MLDSGVILMRGQERGMGGADGWMVGGGGGAKKGVHRTVSVRVLAEIYKFFGFYCPNTSRYVPSSPGGPSKA